MNLFLKQLLIGFTFVYTSSLFSCQKYSKLDFMFLRNNNKIDEITNL